MSHFSGFYKKTRAQRIDLLAQQRDLSPDSRDILQDDRNLSEAIAGQMAENHLGTFSLPFSVLPEFVLNGKEYSLPMVTEEPSVVAAASFAAKIIAKSGGFQAQVHQRRMIGQVALYEIPQMGTAKEALLAQTDAILALANQAHPSIVKRGGGAQKLSLQEKEDFLIVYLHVDVQEAMGANILNTMLEAIKDYLEDLTGGTSLMAILSNYATDSLVSASCRIPIRYLKLKEGSALDVANRMVLASRFAQLDAYRAATHNKGIFNGIDALLLATGNDWRAIEAGAHAYASKDGHYQGLSQWTLDGDFLVGQLTLPMPVATVGGSIGLNPKVQAAFDLLGQPSAKELASLVVALGLCQNFAALRALITSGIQQGHMKLQAKSLALLAGATENEVETVARLLRLEPHTNLETTTAILQKIRTQTD